MLKCPSPAQEDRATLGSDPSAEAGERRRGRPFGFALLLSAPLEFPKAINPNVKSFTDYLGAGSVWTGEVLFTTRSIAL
jgi:hypothetical protein